MTYLIEAAFYFYCKLKKKWKQKIIRTVPVALIEASKSSKKPNKAEDFELNKQKLLVPKFRFLFRLVG